MAADTFKMKRGTTAQVNAYTPDAGEPVFDLTLKKLRVGDGVTLGGYDPTLYNGNLNALADLVGVADGGFYFTGTSTMSLYTLSALGRTLGGIANDTAGRAVLTAAKSGANSDITSLTGLTTQLSIAQGGTGNAIGLAATATALATSRSISATGDATWTVSFDGTSNATAALTLAASGVGAGTYDQVTVDAKGRVTAGVTVSAFTNFTLLNSWTAAASRRAVYRKVGDCVMIEMHVVSGTSTDGTVIATLPAGFRPPAPILIPVSSGFNVAPSATVAGPSINIGSSGDIACFNCTNTPGIRFSVTIPLV